MFQRFSDHARQVVVRAQEESRELHHGSIDAIHLLLGLLRVCEAHPDTTAAHALTQLGIAPSAVIDGITLPAGPVPTEASGFIPFTSGAKKVLEVSLREALSLNDNSIRTGHLLLSIASIASHQPGTDLAVAFASLGTSYDKLRQLLCESSLTTEAGPASRLPFSTLAGMVLARAQIHARQTQSASVNTEHLLLGLIDIKDGLAARAFQALGIDRTEIGSETMRLIAEEHEAAAD